ncbi:MAG TPA: dihydrodipicolinate synthase family protein [Acidobacteriaceae bacterium]|jgi:dihydrodipicolinate synthase/N-acetylneuraminate lyase|nr:dihydrodipicolinate synthase family protein [Acidobacteriaceae bacterium]
MLLEGIFPAITTPYYPDGRLYLRKLEHNVERYSRTVAAGLVVLGSTGEAVMLSDDETREVLRSAAQSAAPDKVLLAGVGRESLRETLRLAEFAADQQFDAVLVRTPHFYGPQMQPLELLTYYRTLADHSPLPVVLYSIPKFTHLELPVDVVAELAQHLNIIAIKDSSGSLDRLASLVAATRSAPKRSVVVTPVFAAVTSRMMLAEAEAETALAASLIPVDALGAEPMTSVALAPMRSALAMRKKEIGFQVLTGSAGNLLPALDAGVSGAILAFAAPAPQACQEIYTAWKENDPVVAAEKQRRLAQPSLVVANKYGIPGLKYACDLNGYYGGSARLPLLSLTSDQRAEVAAAMADTRN